MCALDSAVEMIEPQMVLSNASDATRKHESANCLKTFPTSPLLIRRSFKKAQNDPIPVEKIILIQDIIKEKSKQAERGVDVLMTPTQAKKSKTAFATPATTPATFTTNNKGRLATPKSERKQVQRSNSMTTKETPVKSEGLATSFLRYDFQFFKRTLDLFL